MEGLWSIQWEVVMARVWSMVSLSSFLTSRTVAVIICRHGGQPSATVSNLWVDRPQVSPVFEPILLCHPLIVVYKQLRRFSNVWKGKPWCLPKSCFKALKACLSSIQAFPSFGGFIENPEVAIFHWTQEFPYLPFGCRWGCWFWFQRRPLTASAVHLLPRTSGLLSQVQSCAFGADTLYPSWCRVERTWVVESRHCPSPLLQLKDHLHFGGDWHWGVFGGTQLSPGREPQQSVWGSS